MRRGCGDRVGAHLFGDKGVLGPLEFLAQSGVEHLVRTPQRDVVALGQLPDAFVRYQGCRLDAVALMLSRVRFTKCGDLGNFWRRARSVR